MGGGGGINAGESRDQTMDLVKIGLLLFLSILLAAILSEPIRIFFAEKEWGLLAIALVVLLFYALLPAFLYIIFKSSRKRRRYFLTRHRRLGGGSFTHIFRNFINAIMGIATGRANRAIWKMYITNTKPPVIPALLTSLMTISLIRSLTMAEPIRIIAVKYATLKLPC